MIVAMWAGGISADLWFVATGAGLVGPPSPGSIFAYIAMLPRGGAFAVLGGVAIATAASAVVGVILLKSSSNRRNRLRCRRQNRKQYTYCLT